MASKNIILRVYLSKNIHHSSVIKTHNLTIMVMFSQVCSQTQLLIVEIKENEVLWTGVCRNSYEQWDVKPNLVSICSWSSRLFTPESRPIINQAVTLSLSVSGEGSLRQLVPLIWWILSTLHISLLCLSVPVQAYAILRTVTHFKMAFHSQQTSINTLILLSRFFILPTYAVLHLYFEPIGCDRFTTLERSVIVCWFCTAHPNTLEASDILAKGMNHRTAVDGWKREFEQAKVFWLTDLPRSSSVGCFFPLAVQGSQWLFCIPLYCLAAKRSKAECQTSPN